MKRSLVTLIAAVLPLSVHADIRLPWTYARLRDEADLIAVATPSEVKATAERTPLPDTSLMGAGVETKFEILAVLKGDATLKSFVLHHYRDAEPEKISVNGPLFVSFDPQQKKRFLLFLKREADGRFCAVSPQRNPTISIQELPGFLP